METSNIAQSAMLLSGARICSVPGAQSWRAEQRPGCASAVAKLLRASMHGAALRSESISAATGTCPVDAAQYALSESGDMAEIIAAAWRCGQCGHVWLKGSTVPTHCARCKSRRWDVAASLIAPPAPVAQLPARPAINMDALRETCAGRPPGDGVGSLAPGGQPIEDNRPCCIECDKRMTAKMYKGFAVAWACSDQACPMYGLDRRQ